MAIDENKKQYSIIGRVEIGTDEYRDLIESVARAEKERDEADSRRWDYYHKNEEANKKLEKLQEKYDLAIKFLKDNSERYNDYLKYVAENQ